MIEFTYREAARFMSKVDRTGDCWLWLAAKDGAGYGFATVGKQRQKAHRAAYELLIGPIPEGLQLDHLCRNPPCVNPAHLEPVTGRENTLRGISPIAVNARKTRCKRGHSFTPENTIHRPSGRRACRTCKAVWDEADRRRRGMSVGQVTGERNAWSKLTTAQVVAIRAANSAGTSQADLARQFGVHHDTIGLVVRRKRWKEV